MILVVVVFLAPVFAGAVEFYGCISSITGAQVPLAAKNAYLERLRAGASESNFVKCGAPDEVPSYFYGIPSGTEWRFFCAYIKNGSVLKSESFSINRCKATRNWEHVDEGFPKPAQGSGYDSLM